MKKKATKKTRMDMSQRALSIVKEATGIDSLVSKKSPKGKKKESTSKKRLK